MFRYFSIALASGMILLVLTYGGFAFYHGEGAGSKSSDGAVTIIEPEDGVTVRDQILRVRFKVDKGKNGDHVHIYLNGRFVKAVYKESYILNLRKGKNIIEIRLAARDHAELGPSSRITVYRE